MFGRKAKQILETMPKTKSSISIDKQEAGRIEAWRIMMYQEIEVYHKDTIPQLQAIENNVIQAFKDLKVHEIKLEETPDPKREEQIYK